MACDTVQNFCASCQKAGQHSDIFCDNQTGGFKFSKLSEPKNKAFKEFINEAIDAIKKIGNYGKKGTKKPSADKLNQLNTVESKFKIGANDFNSLLNVLDIENKDVKSKQILLGSYMGDLADYINNYELSFNLCDDCNDSCQSGQSCSQGGDCGESGCSSPGCLGGICAIEVGCDGCNVGYEGCGSGESCTCQSTQGCASSSQSGCGGTCQSCNTCQFCNTCQGCQYCNTRQTACDATTE